MGAIAIQCNRTPDFCMTIHTPMTSPDTDPKQLNERVKALQRAVYYLVWKRTGFGEQCIHCGHAYPGHEDHCKAAEVEQLVR
jgi:hypothetical protein